MGRYLEASCKVCRREGVKLFLKGVRCYTPKCAMEDRNYPPGMHGQQGSRKPSNYGLQLREKQKLKRSYGLLEDQFKFYFKKAAQSKRVTGPTLLRILERRLDNVIYRSHFVLSRKYARQMVNHRHVLVNGRVVNIPSFQVGEGDKIQIKVSEKLKADIKKNIEASQDQLLVDWLQRDTDQLTVQVKRLPERSDIQETIQEQLVVELYSK